MQAKKKQEGALEASEKLDENGGEGSGVRRVQGVLLTLDLRNMVFFGCIESWELKRENFGI